MGLILAAVIAAPLSGQPKDIDGWGKIRWGMTLEQAKTLLVGSPVRETKDKGGAPSLIIDNFEIYDGLTAEVHINAAAKEPHGIGDISLEPTAIGKVVIKKDPNTDDADRVVEGARRQVFDHLKRLLIEKYGDPKSNETRQDNRYALNPREETTVLWVFPSTSIDLRLVVPTRFDNPRYRMPGWLLIEYTVVKQSAL
jgi:hypothetical protein